MSDTYLDNIFKINIAVTFFGSLRRLKGFYKTRDLLYEPLK